MNKFLSLKNLMVPTRTDLLLASQEFCEAFARGDSPESILKLFSTTTDISAIEYGDPELAPFLGKVFEGEEGVKEYFETIGRLLVAENTSFSEYMVDEAQRKVSMKGNARFTWRSTGKAWNETFAYVLDFDEDARVFRYQIWSDTGSAYLASQDSGSNGHK